MNPANAVWDMIYYRMS